MKPATDWQEVIAPDENVRFEQYAQELAAIQAQHAQKRGVQRALHAKINLGVRGQFNVLSEIPEYARVGLFATPASYHAYVRFSNGQSTHRPDAKPDVRGVGIKLLGVDGKKLIPGMENEKTQDFLLIKNVVLPVRNAAEFMALARNTTRPATLLPRMVGQIGFGATLRVLRAVLPVANDKTASLATTRYTMPVPIKFGPYAAHLALSPHAKDGSAAGPSKDSDYLGRELAQRLRVGPVVYDFQVQFYVDAARTPIEDASVEWQATDSPFITVAQLVLLQQDVSSEQGQALAKYIDTLSFDPWHAQTELRPLGDIMRARSHAYRVSTQARNAAPEPDGSESFAAP